MRARWYVRARRSDSPKRSRDLKIPPTVQAILAARIDRLPTNEKDLLQALAVIGQGVQAKPGPCGHR